MLITEIEFVDKIPRPDKIIIDHLDDMNTVFVIDKRNHREGFIMREQASGNDRYIFRVRFVNGEILDSAYSSLDQTLKTLRGGYHLFLIGVMP